MGRTPPKTVSIRPLNMLVSSMLTTMASTISSAEMISHTLEAR